MTQAPFTIDPALTAVVINHGNREGREYIADRVSPRVQVATPEFRWTSYAEEEAFSLPDANVGRKSRPNEVEFTATEQTGGVKDYGLDAPVPNRDIAAAVGTQFSPENRAARLVTDKVDLNREVRVANMVFGAGNYLAGNKQTLSGTGATGQWSAEDSAPYVAITDKLDAMTGMRPNVAVLGQQVLTQLMRNKDLSVRLGGANKAGQIVMLQELASLFGLQEVIVGNALVATTKRGQTLSTSRIWGKHAAFIYVPPGGMAADGEPAFSLTYQWRGRVAGRIIDPDMGLEGGVRIRSGEYLDERVVSPGSGYLFTNAVA